MPSKMVAEYFKRDELNNSFCGSLQVSSKPICLICNNAVLSLNDYNIERHYVTIHALAYDKFEDQFRRDKVAELKNVLAG